jgi:hypothetical protein
MFDLKLTSVVPSDATPFQVKRPIVPALFEGTENRLPPGKESIGQGVPILASGILRPMTSPASNSTLLSQATLWNKYLNDSGQPNRFRVDPNSDKVIQEINPATDKVIGEYPVAAFPALAKSLGVVGSLIDRRL